MHNIQSQSIYICPLCIGVHTHTMDYQQIIEKDIELMVRELELVQLFLLGCIKPQNGPAELIPAD